MALSVIKNFVRLEAAAGVLLLIATLLALAIANSPASGVYASFLDARLTIAIDGAGISKPLLLWINDGLMAIFFLLVGLEIKRELLEGELSSVQKAALPAIAALGGMVVPALVYAALNWGDAQSMRGWAIPTATDIAFAVGVVALLGDRVPPSLKVFLLALAIIDDLGAIVIIAIFYTDTLSALSLGLAAVALVCLTILNRARVMNRAPYVITGVLLWICVLKSGVHATLAGVALAFAIPLKARARDGESPLHGLEDALHPWVSYAILPLFAFANAGVSLSGISLRDFFEPLPLGIAAGLFIGKQIGVMAAIWLAVTLRLSALPSGAGWRHVYGMALLTGIGFTMSLFIGTLAFDDPAFASRVRMGVLGGSLLSALCGTLVLRMFASERAQARHV